MTITIHQGDCRTELAKLAEGSVNCCVTSPPYWGLRDYGVDSQIGLEKTPDEFVAQMVAVFREVRRVLRDDGTLWLNLGDSYNAYNANRGRAAGANKNHHEIMPSADRGLSDKSLKNKDLVGIPWMVAFALRADGWYLRQDIIWHKPNPMPESVSDRCTKAHEYLFLMTKSDRYYFNQDAIKERSITNDPRRPYTSEGAWEMDGRPEDQRHGGEPRSHKGSKFHTGKTATHQLDRASKKPRTAGNKTHKYVEEYEASETEEHRTKAGLLKVADVPWESANKRSVWAVATQPYGKAHFATFPPKLIEPCILAGCPEGGTVLDPFLGSGTTALVADRNGCNCVGIELNPEYIKLANERLEQRSLFTA